MRYLKQFKYLPALCLMYCILAASCKQNQQNSNVNLPDTLEFNTYAFPSELTVLPPIELLYDIKESGIYLSPDNVNSIDKLNEYTSIKAKTINLGIYFADFAYLISINQHNKLLNYLENIHQLSKELNIQGLLSGNIIDRFKNNLTNTDSLYYLTLESHNIIVNQLNTTDRQATLLLISMGALIESFYLLSTGIETQEQLNLIFSDINNNSFIFEEYYNYALQYKEEPGILETLNQITPLHNFLNSSYSTETETIHKNPEKEISISGGRTIKLDLQKFEDLKGIVSNIRNNFTNQN